MNVDKPANDKRQRRDRLPHEPHPLVWWCAAVVLAMLCALTALWRNADEEPKVALGTRVPAYLGEALANPGSAASGSSAPNESSAGTLIPVSR